jgi:Tol biopolymer transport system component
MRRARLVLVLLALTLLYGAVAARAEAPAGPRLAVVVSHPYPNAGTEVSSLALDGSAPFRIAGGHDTKGPSPITEARPSWSADGSRVAFFGVRDGASGAIFTVAADGSEPKVVPLSRKLIVQGDVALAPDGSSVAVMRLDVISGHFERPRWRGRRSGDEYGVRVRTAIWALGAEGSKMRPLSTWSRKAFLEPSSFSPDGSHLAATEWREATHRAISIDLSTRRATVLADNAREPVYAPDGRVAIVRDHFGPKQGAEEERKRKSSTLLVIPAGGGRPQPLARIRPGLSSPSWDPSGQRIAFTRLGGYPGRFSLFPKPNSIAEINADGTCLTTVAKLNRGFFGGSAWQPGPGREAGPIVC